VHNFGTCKENVAAQCQLLKLALPLPLLYHVKKRVSPKIIIFGETRFLIGSRHCTAAFSLQVLKLYTDLDPTLLHILILRTYTKFILTNIMLAMFASRRHARALAANLPCRNHVTFTLLPTDDFVSTTTNSMKYVVNWIPLIDDCFYYL